MIDWFSETPEFGGELPEGASLKQQSRHIARHFFPRSQSTSRKNDRLDDAGLRLRNPKAKRCRKYTLATNESSVIEKIEGH
jgi:hypothetical protein